MPLLGGWGGLLALIRCQDKAINSKLESQERAPAVRHLRSSNLGDMEMATCGGVDSSGGGYTGSRAGGSLWSGKH